MAENRRWNGVPQSRGGDRRRGRFGVAVLASALLHGGALAFFWVSASRAAELPKMRIYSVNIVSPPPQEAGEPTPAVAPPDPVPAPLEPTPPEPSPPPPPTKEVEPKPAPPKKKPVPPKEKKPEPKPVPKETKPAPKETPPKKAERTPEAAKPTPPKGSNPSATSAGGEGLNVRIEGVEFTDPAYLANIIRQVNRYFRPPSGARTDVAEVIFWINRDGSVSDIQLGRSSGSFPFRAAAMEAVEQAGLNKAFGPLPESYPADRLPVSFEFKPAR